MKDIVNIKFIKSHEDEILTVLDVIPFKILNYIPYSKIENHFEENIKNYNFSREYKTVDEWINSENPYLDDYKFYRDEEIRKFYKKTDYPEEYTQRFEEYIELLEDWVDCYPEFEGVLNRKYFKEYVENEGIFDQSHELVKIEKNFHNLIMQRAGNLIEKFEIPLPNITIDLLENNQFKRECFPVPGMYGGFYYYLDINENGKLFLDVDSWSRICGGSGQTHIITAKQIELVDEGYV